MANQKLYASQNFNHVTNMTLKVSKFENKTKNLNGVLVTKSCIYLRFGTKT